MGKKKVKKKGIKLYYERYIGGSIILFISFFTYLKTLTPSIALHDSGELVTSAYILGIPHPPGYPLYCLLGKLWITILPIGNIAYRMNLVSALCASFSCMLVFFITLKMIHREPNNNFISRFLFLVPAIISALMLAFATTFWEQAVIAEKYTLNALFTTLLIFILLKWQEVVIERPKTTDQRPQTKSYFCLFAFTLGLSFTHHFQTTFLIPASLFFIISICWEKWQKEKPLSKVFGLWSSVFSLRFLVFGLLPLSLYLYLPLRAISQPGINMGDPQTMERFLEHIKTSQFSGYFGSSIFDVFSRCYTYLTQFFAHQFTIYLVVAGLIGAFFLFKQQLRFFIFLSLILITNIFYSLFYNIPNIQDYYLPAFIIFAIWIGYGVQGLINLMRKKVSLIYHLSFTICLLLPLIPFIINYQHNDRSQYYFADDLVRNILSPIEKKPIIFLETDDTAYPVWYAYYVERQNTDAMLIDVPFLAVHYDWYVRTLKEKYPDLSFSFRFEDMLGIKTKELERIRIERIYNIISNNINSHSIYKLYDDSYTKSYSLIPQGIFCKVFEKDIDKKRLCRELDKNKRFLYRQAVDEKILDERTRDLISRYPQTYYNIGSFYFGINNYDMAIEKFNQALKINPKQTNARYGLGMAYKNKGMFAEAMNSFNEILKLEPRFAKAYYGIGCIYQEKGKISEAIESYKKALLLEPELNFVRVNLGVAYLNQNRFEEAIFEFKKVIELNPQDVNTYFNLGIAYTKNKEYQNAIVTYQKILQLVPNHPSALANLYSLTQ